MVKDAETHDLGKEVSAVEDKASIIFRVRAPGANIKKHEMIYIVGGTSILGDWDEKNATPLVTGPKLFPLWTTRPLTVDSDLYGKTVEYKYFKQKWLDPDGDEEGFGESSWEPLAARSIKFPVRNEHLLVSDTFGVAGRPPVAPASPADTELTTKLVEEAELAGIDTRQLSPTSQLVPAGSGSSHFRRQTTANIVASSSSHKLGGRTRDANTNESSREEGIVSWLFSSAFSLIKAVVSFDDESIDQDSESEQNGWYPPPEPEEDWTLLQDDGFRESQIGSRRRYTASDPSMFRPCGPLHVTQEILERSASL